MAKKVLSFDRCNADSFFSLITDKGYYVDIGVREGVHDNKTFLLYNNGWSGICVDAHPDYANICKIARPTDTVLSMICGKDDKNCKFRYNWRGSFGSIYNEELDSKRKLYVIGGDGENCWYGEIDENKNYLGFKNSIEHSESQSLNTILDKYNTSNTKIDVLSIDVDGAEQEILKHFDIKKYNPSFVCIEIERALEYMGDFKEKEFIFNYMKEHDYIPLCTFNEDYIWCNSQENHKLGIDILKKFESKEFVVQNINTIHPCNYLHKNKLQLNEETIRKYIDYINSLY